MVFLNDSTTLQKFFTMLRVLKAKVVLFYLPFNKQKVGSYFNRSKYPLHFTNSVKPIKCQATVIEALFYSFSFCKKMFQILNQQTFYCPFQPSY
ncbi:hypothetical protein AWN68_14615 [Roseivirga echinicomitans]|uniref:Uncharacterized protein n=1 Tax=Roseivirga echinicomitans TaxID=296218 RepID=A0A150XV16_9BACT|nr:hypothetical protein AWN68_14615 [Roseivirga echinicomitans]